MTEQTVPDTSVPDTFFAHGCVRVSWLARPAKATLSQYGLGAPKVRFLRSLLRSTCRKYRLRSQFKGFFTSAH